ACIGQEPFFSALHRPGEGAAGADGIEPIEVAELRRLEDNFGSFNATQGTEGKEGLVLQPLLFPAERLEQALTTDRTGRTAVHAAEGVRQQAFSSQGFGMFESRLLKVARR